MFRTVVSTAIMAALMGWSAEAATLGDVEGAVSVNQGMGFQKVTAGTQLNPGDRIRTGSGWADIVYSNGCTVRVGPHQLALITATPSACGARADGMHSQPLSAGPDPLIAGGFIVAGGTGLGVAIALANDNNGHAVNPASGSSSPASP